MTERYYEKHHWQAAQAWATAEGSSEEVARRLISAWNSGSGLAFGYNFREYPDTPEFISELAQLISSARNSEESQIVEDGVGDSLCSACRRQRC